MDQQYEEYNDESYSDVVEELSHVFDDLTVLGGLSLKQLLDHHHTLGHHRLCKDKTANSPKRHQTGNSQHLNTLKKKNPVAKG